VWTIILVPVVFLVCHSCRGCRGPLGTTNGFRIEFRQPKPHSPFKTGSARNLLRARMSRPRRAKSQDRQSRLVVQCRLCCLGGHSIHPAQCPLSGVKRIWRHLVIRALPKFDCESGVSGVSLPYARAHAGANAPTAHAWISNAARFAARADVIARRRSYRRHPPPPR
jgi:hypothetical protein